MLNPQEALHVGDHLIEDFEGARQAGLHAVLIDRSSDSQPDNQTLSSLSQLSSYDLLYR
jgi:FMN phosphatase YigB (HAD superfamily)